MDAIQRAFAELHEADGKVRIRFHPAVKPPLEPLEPRNWNSTEREMTYRNYMLWLNVAQAEGVVLEWVETVRKKAS